MRAAIRRESRPRSSGGFSQRIPETATMERLAPEPHSARPASRPAPSARPRSSQAGIGGRPSTVDRRLEALSANQRSARSDDVAAAEKERRRALLRGAQPAAAKAETKEVERRRALLACARPAGGAKAAEAAKATSPGGTTIETRLSSLATTQSALRKELEGYMDDMRGRVGEDGAPLAIPLPSKAGAHRTNLMISPALGF